MNSNDQIKIKNSVSMIKKALINKVIDVSEEKGEEVDVALLKVINNLNDDNLIANALDYVSLDENFLALLMNNIEQSRLSDDMPF